MTDENENSDVVIPFIGLKNKGNTCYLNSVLQILYHCPSFCLNLANFSSFLADIDESLKIQSSTKNNEENKESLLLMKELWNLFLHLNQNQLKLIEDGENLSEDEIKALSAVCPQEFIGCLRNLYPVFEPYTQQDAQECFHCILNICNSVIPLLNENFQKSDMPQFAATESKVVGGRRSHSVLVSSQNKENTNSGGVLSAGPSTSSGKLLQNSNKQLKPAALLQQRKNRAAIEISDDENEVAMQKATTGCLKALKRKRLKFGDKEQISSEKAPSTSDEKENRDLGQLSINGETGVEPTPKRRRLGPQHLRTPMMQSQPKKSGFLKSLFQKILNKPKEAVTESSQSTSKSEDFAVVQQELPNETDSLQSTAFSSDKKTHKAADFIKDMFHGQLVTTIKCMECESKVDRFESFQDVSLPVKNVQLINDEDAAIEPDRDPEAQSGMDACSLSWALDHFTSSEALCGDNKYFCNVCRRLSEGERSMRFNKLPPIVTLHLKRFSTNCTDSSNFSTTVSKITCALEIPSTAKFTKWCSSECAEISAEYELFGIVIHSGVSITGGHYLSYVKYSYSESQGNEQLKGYDGRWLEMDDERARLLSNEEMEKALSQGDFDIPSKSAYMLFYHRVDLAHN